MMRYLIQEIAMINPKKRIEQLKALYDLQQRLVSALKASEKTKTWHYLLQDFFYFETSGCSQSQV
jgi:hypothetical protein